MSQTEYNQPNEAMVDARANINSILGAILSANSGSSAPINTEGGSIWLDTSTNVLKRRNAADTGWVTIKSLDDDQVITKTSDYTATEGDHDKIILLDASSNNITLTLPASANVGDEYRVHVKAINVSNDVTITGNSSETIDGLSSITLDTAQDGVTIQSDGANNRILTDARKSKYDNNGNLVVSYTGRSGADSHIEIVNADAGGTNNTPEINVVSSNAAAGLHIGTYSGGVLSIDFGADAMTLPISDGNDGQVLTRDTAGRLLLMYPGVTLIQSQSSTASYEFSDTWSDYVISLSSITTSSDGDRIELRLIDDSGTELTDYDWLYTETDVNSGSSDYSGQGWGEIPLHNDADGLGSASGEDLSGHITIHGARSTNGPTKLSWDIVYIAADGNMRYARGSAVAKTTNKIRGYSLLSRDGVSLGGDTRRVYGYRSI